MSKHRINTAFKRLLLCSTLINTLFALFAFAACQKGDGKLVTAADIYKYTIAVAKFPSMNKLNETDISDFYGIDMARIKSYEMYVPEKSTDTGEIAVFELEDRSYGEELEKLLKQALIRAASIERDYNPQKYDAIMKSTVEKKGSFVFYIVNEDSVRIVEQLKKLITD